LFLLLSLVILQLITRKIFVNYNILKYEYDLIVCFSILGLIILSNCNDFLVLYLAIELQSLSFYVLASFNRNSEYSIEAGLKYFVLGAFSSSLLLLGLSLVYVGYGSVSFENIIRLNFVTDETPIF